MEAITFEAEQHYLTEKATIRSADFSRRRHWSPLEEGILLTYEREEVKCKRLLSSTKKQTRKKYQNLYKKTK